MKFKVVNAFRSHPIEYWAKQSLEPGAYVASDGLACFKAVTKTGCKHQFIVTGGGPESMTLEAFTWVNTMIGNVKNAATGTYHAVSGKHLPRYLAEFNYRFNRRYDLAAMLPRLRCSKNTTNARAFAQARWGVLSFIGNQELLCL